MTKRPRCTVCNDHTCMKFGRCDNGINVGVHIEHCCSIHGCKYGDGKQCSVESGSAQQAHPCEACEYDVAGGPLLEVIKCLIEENDLRKTNREDTIGVLMRCGAFRHVDVALLAREIDKK